MRPINIRQIKLALTVDLMNLPTPTNPLSFIQKAMNRFKDEAGNFTGLLFKGNSKMNEGFEKQSFELQFERCTLDLDLVTESFSHRQFVQGFNLKPVF